MANPKRIVELEAQWHSLMDACKVPRGERRLQAFAELVTAYSEPHRYYHNLDHIAWMLMLVYVFEDPKTFANVMLATWYHDVVYDPRNSENEARSADVAKLSLANLNVAEKTIDRVCEMILMTKGHVCPEKDPEAAAFLGADLGILGTDPTSYAKYAESIRKEYAWVADRAYFEGRRKVLQRFLARPRILPSDWNGPYVEAHARANIAAEIARLDEKLRTPVRDA